MSKHRINRNAAEWPQEHRPSRTLRKQVVGVSSSNVSEHALCAKHCALGAQRPVTHRALGDLSWTARFEGEIKHGCFFFFS